MRKYFSVIICRRFDIWSLQFFENISVTQYCYYNKRRILTRSGYPWRELARKH